MKHIIVTELHVSIQHSGMVSDSCTMVSMC